MMLYCKKLFYFWLAFVCRFLIETAKYRDAIVPRAAFNVKEQKSTSVVILDQEGWDLINWGKTELKQS